MQPSFRLTRRMVSETLYRIAIISLPAERHECWSLQVTDAFCRRAGRQSNLLSGRSEKV